MPKQDLRTPYSLLLLSALIVGLSFLFNKVALRSAGPLDVLSHRFLIAAAASALYGMAAGKRPVLPKGCRLRLVPLALAYPVLFFLLQLLGLQYLSTGQSGLINAAAPVFTAVLAAVFLKERITLPQAGGILLTVLGVALLQLLNLDTKGEGSSLGFLLALGSAGALAANTVLTRVYARQYDRFSLNAFVLFGGCAVFTAAALGSCLFTGNLAGYLAPLGRPDYLLALVYLGVLSTFVTSQITIYALRVLPALPASIVSTFSVLMTLLAGVLFLGEAFRLAQSAGAALILAGVLLVNLFRAPSAH